MADINLLGIRLLQDRLDKVNKDTPVGELKQLLREICEAGANIALFEYNDEFTRTAFRNIVYPILDIWRKAGLLTDYVVVVDQTNNTKKVIDDNQFVADIYIRGKEWTAEPYPAAYRLNFKIASTGLEFEKLAEVK